MFGLIITPRRYLSYRLDKAGKACYNHQNSQRAANQNGGEPKMPCQAAKSLGSDNDRDGKNSESCVLPSSVISKRAILYTGDAS